MKHLSVAGNRNWFRGNNVLFDDMKSPGTTWLISSALLRINIKSYYKLFAELSNQESYHKLLTSRRIDNINNAIDVGMINELRIPQILNANSNDSPKISSVYLMTLIMSKKN